MQRLQEINNKLIKIDWNFSINENDILSSIHSYPAKFIPEIPRTLIQHLEIPIGSWILDPFCGSGTTLTEANRVGIPAVGIDINPIACLISKVKTEPLSSNFSEVWLRTVEEAKKIRPYQLKDIPNVNHWFKKEIQFALESLISEINAIDDPSIRNALRLAFSSIVVRVSNQESDTRYAAIDKHLESKDVFALFEIACRKIEKAISSRVRSNSNVLVIEKDILSIKPDEIKVPVGLVVTSPPYPNAYEYWLYHKYRMWWLGYDPISVKRHEIGARAHFFKKNHHTKESFVRQMDTTIKLISSLLMRSGYACFVIGDSKIHGQIVDNSKIIENIFLSYGLTLAAKLTRVISSNKKSFNLYHARIKEEKILIFYKP